MDVEVLADMVVINPFDFFIEDYAHKFPFSYEENLKRPFQPYLEVTKSDDKLLDLVKEAKALIIEDVSTIDLLVAINQLIYNKLKYNIRMEPGFSRPFCLRLSHSAQSRRKVTRWSVGYRRGFH